MTEAAIRRRPPPAGGGGEAERTGRRGVGSAVPAGRAAGNGAEPRSGRILFVSYTSDWVGPTNSLLHLLRELPDGYEPTVMMPGGGEFARALEREGVRYAAVPRMDKWSIPGTVRLLKRGGFDLLYANNQSGSSRNAILAARLAGVPSVCHVRGMIGEESWSRFWFLRIPAAVVAVSEAAAEGAARFVPRSRLHVVHNGIDVGAFDLRAAADGDGAPEGVRRELGLPADAILVLAVSHVCRRKNQVALVEMLARLRASVPGAHVCVAGSLEREPEYVDRLRRAAERAGVVGRFHLLGFRRDVARIARAADVFVHAATADPHPRAVLEAMAARLPVVAFAADGVAETVAEGETGRLVPVGDAAAMTRAVEALARDERTRRAMGDAGRRRVEERFSAEATARGIESVIRRVLASAGGEGG